MAGYTKIFSSLVDSTVWRESKETKIVWITMLAKADRYGVVEASLPGLADAARVSNEECQKALRVLMEPDPWSRTKEHEGRRVQECDGGWLILNHTKYRDKMSAEDRLERQKQWQAEYRKRKKVMISGAVQGGAQQAIREGFGEVGREPAQASGNGEGEPAGQVFDETERLPAPVIVKPFSKVAI